MIQFESISSELLLNCALTTATVICVLVPFRRGLSIFFQARAATRPVDDETMRASLVQAPLAEDESLAITTFRVFNQSLEENREGVHPTAFIRDASKQYALDEYEAAYSQPMSMYANLLPPLGFIGTTLGLLVLLVSMRIENASLELGALAVALTSTITGLIGFATLEGLKIRLSARLRLCVDTALSTAPTAS